MVISWLPQRVGIYFSNISFLLHDCQVFNDSGCPHTLEQWVPIHFWFCCLCQYFFQSGIHGIWEVPLQGHIGPFRKPLFFSRNKCMDGYWSYRLYGVHGWGAGFSSITPNICRPYTFSINHKCGVCGSIFHSLHYSHNIIQFCDRGWSTGSVLKAEIFTPLLSVRYITLIPQAKMQVSCIVKCKEERIHRRI